MCACQGCVFMHEHVCMQRCVGAGPDGTGPSDLKANVHMLSPEAAAHTGSLPVPSTFPQHTDKCCFSILKQMKKCLLSRI